MSDFDVRHTIDFSEPITKVVGVTSDGTGYVVACREHGDVTYAESEFTVTMATLPQAGLYQRRHLAKHLTALAAEIMEASR